MFHPALRWWPLCGVYTAFPILLTGPTGAGKSQLAKRIYELKKLNKQIKGSFVNVNCATLRGDHAMSSLFGHTKGAFTGAVNDRPGLLKSADGGCAFLFHLCVSNRFLFKMICYITVKITSA